ncbi:hypothetical protein I2I05_08860 [Hymenobacter sp. BT683]|uniref:Uncharacterized protein n=1 Tax=Hymenobacter jeongseonensis TaxID=2791027 RepID=A0ABS0IGM1_9BACT|nr:hypothetical protein [Hymenobacter jeongseonensis]MBF9237504.1 hypothetical protein [Hymenobacter jeongseonensis]
MQTPNLEYLNAPLPTWVAILFVACTALAAVLLGKAIGGTGNGLSRYWLLTGLWLAVSAALGLTGFYQSSLDVLPPRLLVAGILPPALVITSLLLAPAGRRWMARLPLADLVAISVVRVPVEVGLYGLAMNRLVPELMTFAGRNFDILAGLTALLIVGLLRTHRISRGWLMVWHVAALMLLNNIVVLALLAAPTPAQQLAFEQPNVAVLRFPYVWLPAFIVPVVLFSHVASLYKLLRRRSVLNPELP